MAKEVKEAKKTTAKVAEDANEIQDKAEGVEATPEQATETSVTEKSTAKAGKRSAKALKETAEKQAKEERKASGETSEKQKPAVKPARSKLERRGKLYRKSAGQLESGKVYSLEQAIDLAQKTSFVKFDASVEMHINLSVDPKQADQNVRDNLVLPAGTGKSVRIAVLTDEAAAAKSAGADLAGNDELLAELDKGKIDFDVLIATPALMARLGKYARVLGPRGLMPNPKSGTVTNDINKAVAEAKAGKVEYRVDSSGIIHLAIGKVSFTPQQLTDNAVAILTSVKNNKPSSVKSNYIKSIYLTTSMGPSISVDLASVV